MSLPSVPSDSALAASLQSRLPQTLKSLCSQASPNLPALESTCRKALSLTGGLSGTDRLSQLLSGDPALTCKVLQVANSLAYSPQQPITSVSHAVTWLGMDTVRGIVDSAHLVEYLHQRPASRQIVHGVIARALASAVHALELGMTIRYASHGQLFTCALLYAVGDLAVANQDPELYRSLRRLSLMGNAPADRAATEMTLLKVPKLRLAQALAQMWSLPPALVELFAAAHEQLPDRWQTDQQQLKGLVEGASALVAALTGPLNPALIARIKRGLQIGIGLSDDGGSATYWPMLCIAVTSSSSQPVCRWIAGKTSERRHHCNQDHWPQRDQLYLLNKGLLRSKPIRRTRSAPCNSRSPKPRTHLRCLRHW